MRIGIAIGRIGGIDGVALETEKWIAVLERMGHEVFVLTGELEAPIRNASILPEMAFSHPECIRDQDDAFFFQEVDEGELAERLERGAAVIETGIRRWLTEQRIEFLITQNNTTLPCHLTMGMALRRVLESTGIDALAHDHDFHWERGDRYATRYAVVKDIIEECFPPHLPNLRHAVINTYCRDSLRRELDLDSVVVPNVMDFGHPYARRDEFNRDLPEALGFKSDDTLLFQITRIVRRKGIETAIELVHRLGDPAVKLIITGTSRDDWNEEYTNELRGQVADLGLQDSVLFAGDRFGAVRGKDTSGRPVFSLEDAYAHATACTYFSRYEGFGNAFVEAILARRPIFVNNYKPVYWPDIGSKGFLTVQIEDNELTDDAVDAIRSILSNPAARREIGEHNFELGRRYFCFDVLEELLDDLLPR
ncbi:MAG: glycosyltransferase [Planctomycetota bacterium]|jgi:glycosyltransferase involved in cell wall biosynthesis